MKDMPRPCFLVVDREHAGSISTRKLVIETAKLNVITAYSGQEALEALERFPRVDGVILDAGIPDLACEEAVQRLKQAEANVPVIVIGTPRVPTCQGADHFLEGFEPGKLLALLQTLVPETRHIMDREKTKPTDE